jgi:hypothetical protein
MHRSLAILRAGAAAIILAVTLGGCDTVMEGLVGPTKKDFESTQAKAKAAALAKTQPPPGQPGMAAFVTDSALAPGFVGNAVLPPTLSTDTYAAGVDEPLPPSSAGPHAAIASVPLSADGKTLATLGSAANRDAGAMTDTQFVLLVLSPPANDASALDKGNAVAREAANQAVKAMGDAGIAADRIEISMATNPTVGNGEIRLYRR